MLLNGLQDRKKKTIKVWLLEVVIIPNIKYSARTATLRVQYTVGRDPVDQQVSLCNAVSISGTSVHCPKSKDMQLHVKTK